MNRPFKIELVLSPRQLARFRALAVDRRHSIDALSRWLADRGHEISRDAVWKYRRSVANEPLALLRNALGVRSDAMARMELHRAAAKLSGQPLALLALLASISVATSKTRQPIEGRSMEAPARRRNKRKAAQRV